MYNYVKNTKGREKPTHKNEVSLSVNSVYWEKDWVYAAEAESKWKAPWKLYQHEENVCDLSWLDRPS